MSALAAELFEAISKQSRLESDIFDAITEIVGRCGYLGFDDYDASVEIYSVAADLVLTQEQQNKLWTMGFRRCWTHTTSTRDHSPERPGERAYACPDEWALGLDGQTPKETK